MTGLIERMMHPWLTDVTCEITHLQDLEASVALNTVNKGKSSMH